MSQHSVEQLESLLKENERQRAELVARLNMANAYPASTTAGFEVRRQVPSSRPSLTDKTPSRSNPMPPGVPIHASRQPTHDQQDQSRPMKRSKTTHAARSCTTAPMVRSRSSISSSNPNPNPFVTNALHPISPPPTQHSLPVASPGILGDYLTPGLLAYQSHVSTDASFLGGQLHQYGDFGREISMEEFMSNGEDLYPTISPISMPSSAQPSPQASQQFPTSSLPSVCGSMTSAPTLDTAPMSRCNSSINDGASISGQFSEMVRIQSQQSARSYLLQENLAPSPTTAYPSSLGKRRPGSFTATTMLPQSFTSAYPSSAAADSALPQHQHPMQVSISQQSTQSISSAEPSPYDFHGPSTARPVSHPMEISASQQSMQPTSSAEVSQYDVTSPFLAQHLSMQRSVSKESVKSNASLKLRAKEALARQNNAAKSRLLQPKPAAGTGNPENAEAATGKDGKAVITKAKYERPKHPKVKCNQCNEHPEGFRGEHELRRHTEAKHKSLVKKWVCRDPDLANPPIPHAENVVKPLKDCKQCSQGKRYGAYYNAAAHLRRTHFNVKPRRGAAKTGQNKAEEEKEKRGGKGGGDWPPMEELKHWMKEELVGMDQAGDLFVLDGAELEPEERENELPESQNNFEAISPLVINANSIDTVAFSGSGVGFSQGVDITVAAFQGGLDTQLSDMYQFSSPLYTASPLQVVPGVPLASAGFDFTNPDIMQQGIPSSQMTLGGHGYISPVSSTATITQAGVFADQLLTPATVQGVPDELAEMSFDLTFTSPGQ
ncbi:hypothetical protein VTI74DRAFT_314 [Chaetomium olivicolor]